MLRIGYPLVRRMMKRIIGVPVEYHIYAEGGHAFGLNKTGLPIAEWPRLAERWLHTIGMIGE